MKFEKVGYIPKRRYSKTAEMLNEMSTGTAKYYKIESGYYSNIYSGSACLRISAKRAGINNLKIYARKGEIYIEKID